MQPCFSPVWDTALAALALSESGPSPDDPRLLRAAGWLIDREVRVPGDWQRQMPKTPPGGWFFEYANGFYPDTDDTAEVLTALAAVRFPDEREERRRQGRRRARRGLAARHAERRRGLARVRPRLRQRGADVHPVRRPQRDDRPELRGHHRPDARSLRPDRDRPRGEIRAARGRVSCPPAGRRRHVVRALGLQLHLRHVARAARGSTPPARTSRRSATSGRGAGCGAIRTRTGAGASSPFLRRAGTERDRPEHAVADGLGADGALRARRHDLTEACAAASSTSCATSNTTGPGRTNTGPAPGFRRSSTCATISTRRTSRSGRSRFTSGRRVAGRAGRGGRVERHGNHSPKRLAREGEANR